MQKLGPIKRIITMTNEWFTKERYKRNCIDMIRDAGYETEIWNVNKVVFSVEAIPDIPNDLYRGEVTVKNFESREELREELRKCRYDSLILNWYADWSATPEICTERVRYCNMTGAPVLGEVWLNNLAAYYEKITPINIIRRLYKKIQFIKQNNNQLLIKKWPPIYNFAATPAEYMPIYRFTPKSKMRFIHAIDYDKYILDENKDPKDEGYILFIDQSWGTHPEDKSYNWIFSENEVEFYYELMRKLFDLLEEYYNKKVIIAAHPKAQYYGKEYGDREIRQFQTYELIKNSNFVIFHASTTMDWIFLFEKPCLQVIYDKMNKYMGSDMYNIKSYCGLKTFDLEQDSNPWDYLFYDRLVYQRYLRDFVVTDETDKRLFMEVVLDEISKI